MQTRLHMSCIEMDVLLCDWAITDRPYYRIWLEDLIVQGFHRTYACGMPTEDAYSSGHLVLSHFGTCMCSNVETNLSWTCLVSGPLNFEHPSVLLFCLAYDAQKMSWTRKSCAGLDSDIPSEKRSNLSYWIYIALFVLSLNETQKNYTWCMVSLSRDTYLVNTRNYPSLTIQFFVKLHSVVQEASVRIGIKGSWRLWFGKWVLYFIECYISYIRSLRYSGLWHWVRKYVVTWPGLSATSVQWRQWNSAQLLMSRVLFFS